MDGTAFRSQVPFLRVVESKRQTIPITRQGWDRILASALVDFSGTPVDTVDVRLMELDPDNLDEESATIIEDLCGWVDPDAPGRHRLLLKIDNNVASVEPMDNVATLTVDVLSHLQDFVMDELGAPWPEVENSDQTTSVLEPTLDIRGRPGWKGKYGIVCLVGELRHRLKP